MDLAMNSMGADIMGAGTGVIKIRGVEKLHGAEYSIYPTRLRPELYGCRCRNRGDVLQQHYPKAS